MSKSTNERADGRKAWTTHITDEAREQFRQYADAQGVSVGVLFESLASVLDPAEDPFDPAPLDMRAVIVHARALAAQGRSRMGNRNTPFGRDEATAA